MMNIPVRKASVLFYNARMKTLIWDFNGTIIDDVDIDIEIENILLKERGMALIPSREWYLEHFRFPVRDYYDDLGYTFTDEETYDDISVEYQKLYRRFLPYIQLNKGVRRKLAEAAELGYRNVIVSASEQSLLEQQVRDLGIFEYFDALIGIPDILAASKVGRAREWMRKDAVDPADCIYIGDTDHDMDTARALGIETVYLVTFGHQAEHILRKVCDRVISSLDEVIL